MRLLVFMYHRVLPFEHPESVEIELFKRQLDHITANFKVLTPDQCVDFIKGKSDFGRGNYAALTFDDGWWDNMAYASPVLKSFGLSALMAVSAGSLHASPVRDSVEKDILCRSCSESQAASRSGDNRNYLSFDELSSMSETGCWKFAAHGTRHELGSLGQSILSHPQNGMDKDQFGEFLKADIINCREKISGLNGLIDDVFFWPWGHYSDFAVDIARRCGYTIQFTTSKGAVKFGDDRKILPRIGVSRWKKLKKNCIVFKNPVFSWVHDCFHTEKLKFD